MMLRELLSSRWFQGGLVFFLLSVGASLLYSWQVQRITESDMARHDQFLERIEKQNETRTAETVNAPTKKQTPGLLNTPVENKDTPMPEKTEALPNEDDNLADAFLPDDIGSEAEAPAEEVAVSPYGFGPYPEVPEDLPRTEPHPFDWTGKSEQDELIMRVRIKAWTEGDRSFGGGKMIDGKVLLSVPNTVYFRYRETTTDDGSVVRTRVSAVDPDIELPQDFLPGVRVIHFDEAAIDPYEYLDLPQKERN